MERDLHRVTVHAIGAIQPMVLNHVWHTVVPAINPRTHKQMVYLLRHQGLSTYIAVCYMLCYNTPLIISSQTQR